ncbi:FAD-binding oxidoreductase [Actinocorallia sp. A-T 12471]|uniref:FAD-binding oxidoreductase n=1 Tax=Actinocorallia sp. A-T 12471 TaxID=3089813 RepID=UPI0029CD743F|nr:FAD-linked oxidase C-terminal domain-containing protein [Actinocorallia sp. A-T 12471]MDX6744828.1 FAD-linked oxidase C-terminal domain-containing protein [Actinocorallia sp. A-T 12471]
MRCVISLSTVDDLAKALPDSRLITDPDVLTGVSHDEAAWAPVGAPLAALRAGSADEVARAVAACADLGVPVVPRGAGTGLSGGANAVDGCLVLDMSRMNAIVEIDPENMIAVVQPGVVNDDLKAAVAEHGLWYPPDPASAPWSTIGGNVSTNAGGLCCLKYGVTRDYVLGMEAVVGGPAGPYGTRARLGRRTTKGVAGYDLTSLFVGSEGTLGVVTEVTLRLRPARRDAPRTVVGSFSGLVEAGQAVALVTARGLVPAALELLDRTCLQAVEDWKHLGVDPSAEAMLLASVDSPGAAGEEEAEAVATAFRDAGALWAERSSDPVEAEALFSARRLAYPALERLGPVLTEDVCVPRSTVPLMLAKVEEIARRHGIRIATIAHAGDGNLHPLLITPPGDPAARTAAEAAFDDLIAAALALGGTVTGEHGVGLLKRAGMRQELSLGVRAMQRAVKDALDPLNLFNPGKVIGDDPDLIRP